MVALPRHLTFDVLAIAPNRMTLRREMKAI